MTVEFTGLALWPLIANVASHSVPSMNLTGAILKVGHTGLANNINKVLIRYTAALFFSGYLLMVASILFEWSLSGDVGTKRDCQRYR